MPFLLIASAIAWRKTFATCVVGQVLGSGTTNKQQKKIIIIIYENGLTSFTKKNSVLTRETKQQTNKKKGKKKMSIKNLTSESLQRDSVYYVKKHWGAEDKKFYQKNGFLTPYGYACGYMDSFSFGDYEITLSLEGIWHVRIYTKNAPQFLWECFDDTTARKDAQEFFLHLRNMVKKGADPLLLSNEKGYAERLYNARRAA